jgi:hypothetical protein
MDYDVKMKSSFVRRRNWIAAVVFVVALASGEFVDLFPMAVIVRIVSSLIDRYALKNQVKYLNGLMG